MAESPIGGSSLEGNANAEAGRLAGSTTANARTKSALETAAFKEINAEFKELNKSVAKFKSELPSVIKQTKEWANSLKTVSQNMSKVSGGGGGGGSSYMQPAGSNTSVNSNNVTNIYKTFNAPSVSGGTGNIASSLASLAGLGGPAGTALSMGMNVFSTIASMVGQAVKAMDSRIEDNREYALSMSRIGTLYEQMTGIGENRGYHRFREPLQKYKLGYGGINELLGFQATTGLSAQKMAPSIEALRIASGFGYSTGDLLGMTKNLASPQVNNQLFTMLGTGIYGFGGKQKSQQQVYQDIIQRTGLTNAAMIQGAFQQGSNQRYRLLQAGVPEDQIDLILQMAQENLTFQNKTGGTQGFYDPSNKKHAKIMGVTGNYAYEKEETDRKKAVREEKFANRQMDNYAKGEKNEQKIVDKLTSIDETLSGVYGWLTETKPQRSLISKVAGSIPVIGPIYNKIFGDPTEKGSDVPVSRGSSSASSSQSSKKEDTPNIVKSSARLATLNPRFAERVKAMMRDNPRLSVTSAGRSSSSQKNIFLDRYVPTSEKTNVFYAGSYWKHVKGATAAPPGLSMHEVGLAADMYGDENWVAANAHKYQLKSFSDAKEPWHVQPSEFPFGRAQYEKIGAPWGTSGEKFDPSTIWGSVSASNLSESQINPSESRAGSSSGSGGGGANFAWSNMSMGEIIASASSSMGGASSSDSTVIGSGSSPAAGSSSTATASSSSQGSMSSGKALSGAQVAKFMYNAGFRGDKLKRAIAIAWRESRFQPRALRWTSREKSYGLMQINMNDEAVPGLNGPNMGKIKMKRHNLHSAEELFDPATNARVAYEWFSGHTSGMGDLPPAHWLPWGGFKSISAEQMKKSETYIRQAQLPAGDPVYTQKAAVSQASSGGNALYNISISPVITINSSGTPSMDYQRVAKDISNMLEREVRLTMMRTS